MPSHQGVHGHTGDMWHIVGCAWSYGDTYHAVKVCMDIRDMLLGAHGHTGTCAMLLGHGHMGTLLHSKHAALSGCA